MSRSTRRAAGGRLGTPVLAVMAVLCIGTVLLAGWGALRWTLIPERLEGTVALSSPSKDGRPWHELVLEGGAIRTIDTELLDRMGTNAEIHGQEIRKDAWSRTLVLGDRTLDLSPSPQFWRATAMITGLVVVAAVRFVLRFRSSRLPEPGSGDEGSDQRTKRSGDGGVSPEPA
ncbi:MAG: hypothetical protein GX643_04075 [Acidimicrobiales bacterium]|nr:hypothetical protein [Acidimicrobiales bacterium]